MTLRRILLVRHGETGHTRDGRFCGSDDPPLTAHGVACARALADHPALRATRILLSSPARRALDTVRPLAERTRRSPVVLPGLAETHFGRWEGRRYDEVRGTHEHRRWTEDPAGCAPPGGETGLAVQARAVAALDDFLRTTEDVAIVSHKGTIRLLYCHFRKLPPSDYRRLPDVPPASITELWLDKETVVRSVLGDVAHLRGVDATAAGGAAPPGRRTARPVSKSGGS